MSRKAPAPRHAGVSRPVRQERGRKVGHPDQGQRGDRGLTASSIESVACPAYPSSISPLISWEKPMPPSVTVARAGKVSLPLSRPSARVLADRLFDLALGGHAERLEKLPNAGVEDVFVHGHLLCTCPAGHDPRLSCPSLPCGVSPATDITSLSSTYRIRVTKRPPVPSETGAIWP